jgi:hypothetical protein
MSVDEDDSLLRAVAASPPIEPPARPNAPTVETQSPAPELVETSALELSWWGLQFAHRETETDYLGWHRIKAIPFTRVGTILGLLSWGVGLIAFSALGPRIFAITATAVLLIPTPVLIAAVASTYRPRLIRWMLPAALVGDMLSGLTAIAICHWTLSLPELTTPAACNIGFFGFTILRLRPWQGTMAALPFFALNEWVLVEAFGAGRVSSSVLVMDTCFALVAMMAGVVACMAIDRGSRVAYRQERIVAAQRQVIDRLQQAELQRQVAERSRGLSEALARLRDAPRVPARLQLGDIVEDRYKIARPIGSGGMGRVYEIERLADGRRLALKTLSGVAHQEALARFAREAQVAAELEHPNVVAALDIGVTRSGTLFVVMELVAGGSLAAARARYGDARWALPILLQVARALSAMHARGIVHRDLKPANILLDGATAKVADFGLAGLVDGAPLAETREGEKTISPALTRTGAIMGTPLYMAPELAGGAGHAGPSSDVFSLGVVAYELLSKELPFAAPPVLERLSGRAAPAPKPLAVARTDLPPPLCALVGNCLAGSPEARPNAEQLVAALEQIES